MASWFYSREPHGPEAMLPAVHHALIIASSTTRYGSTPRASAPSSPSASPPCFGVHACTSRETTVLSWALACVLCCLVLVCLQRPWTRQCALPFALESYCSASTLRSRRRSRRPSWQTSPFGTPHSIGSRTHAGAVPCALHRWPHMFRARCSYCCGSQCTPPLLATGPSALPSANAARCAAPQEVPP